MSTVTYKDKVYAIVPDGDGGGCGRCVGITMNLGICVEFGAGAYEPTPNCMRGDHHYEEVKDAHVQ